MSNEYYAKSYNKMLYLPLHSFCFGVVTSHQIIFHKLTCLVYNVFKGHFLKEASKNFVTYSIKTN